MNVIELTRRGTDDVAGLACCVCNAVYPSHLRARAELCCSPSECAHDGCNDPRHEYSTLCSKHRHEYDTAERKKAEEQTERERYAKARKVSWREYNRDVYCEHKGPVCDSYAESAVAMARHILIEDGGDLPEYFWGTYPMGLSMNAQDILDNALEEHYDGARDGLDVEKLQKLLDEWCEANDPGGYMVDYDVAITLEGLAEEIRPDSDESTAPTDPPTGDVKF